MSGLAELKLYKNGTLVETFEMIAEVEFDENQISFHHEGKLKTAYGFDYLLSREIE